MLKLVDLLEFQFNKIIECKFHFPYSKLNLLIEKVSQFSPWLVRQRISVIVILIQLKKYV